MGSKKNLNKKKIDKIKLLAVFSLTTLIFIIGLLFGNFVSEKKIDSIQGLQQDLRTDTLATEIQYLLLSENPCGQMNGSILTEELYKINSRIDYMEGRLGENNDEVLRLKEFYSLLQIRHWLLLKKVQKECGEDYNLIHYFYSNKGDCSECEQQGFILTYIRKKYDNVRVYAYDINNKNPALKTLKQNFGVSDTPSLVINGKTYNHFMSKEEIEKLLQ